MNKTIYRIASLIVAFAMLLGNTTHTQATGNVYYVSPTGNDANPGTAFAPFKTFAKANSILTAGSTLNIYAGIYNEQLKISKSGTSSARLTVMPVGGAVVIDLKNAASPAVNIQSSYVTLNNLDVKGSSDICVRLTGKYLRVSGLNVHECPGHGIYTIGQQIEITNNTVYRAALSNQARNLSGGWASGIKVGLAGDDILINNNKVYNNYGEGIAATRGSNVVIRSNTVYDNFSVNIYVDNSFNVLAERNLVTCHANSGFERNGSPATGIGMGEEFYTNWGAKLDRVTITNNIVAFCKHGVRYNGAEDAVVGGGLKNTTIAYNTLYGSTSSALSIAYESAQSGSLIANNIIWQADNKLTYIDNPTGLTFKSNLWKVLPSSIVRGSGDRVGDPIFASTPGYIPESYQPSSLSPAAGGAVDIGIANDFFVKQRGPSFDMGAIQFASLNMTSTSQPTASPIPPTIAPTNTLLSPTPQWTASPIPSTITPSPTLLPPTATLTSVPETSSPTVTLQSPQPSSAETIHDDKDAAFVYSSGWQNVSTSKAYGGAYQETTQNDATVTLPFTGQSFSIIYKGGITFSKFDVYVDGILVGTLDQKLSTATYQQRWDYPGQLAPGNHTLNLVFKVTSGTIIRGSLDAVIVR